MKKKTDPRQVIMLIIVLSVLALALAYRFIAIPLLDEHDELADKLSMKQDEVVSRSTIQLDVKHLQDSYTDLNTTYDELTSYFYSYMTKDAVDDMVVAKLKEYELKVHSFVFQDIRTQKEIISSESAENGIIDVNKVTGSDNLYIYTLGLQIDGNYDNAIKYLDYINQKSGITASIFQMNSSEKTFSLNIEIYMYNDKVAK